MLMEIEAAKNGHLLQKILKLNLDCYLCGPEIFDFELFKYN